MKKKQIWHSLVFLLIGFTSFNFVQQVEGIEANTRNEDLKFIIQESFLDAESFLYMMALEAIAQSNKTLEVEDLINQYRSSFDDAATQAKFFAPYSVFSDDEIHELRRILENPVYKKFGQHGKEIFQSNMQATIETFVELIEKNGIEKEDEPAHNEIIEITKENFSREIEQSSKPIVLDMFAEQCRPCRLMEPTFVELCNKYKGKLKFAKLNCELQQEIAKKYGVSGLPTILFITPGTGYDVSFKIVGFQTKKELEENIKKFLASTDGTT